MLATASLAKLASPGSSRAASLKGGDKGRTLLSKRTGTLWSTALSAERAYVTQIRGTAPRQRILSVGR